MPPLPLGWYPSEDVIKICRGGTFTLTEKFSCVAQYLVSSGFLYGCPPVVFSSSKTQFTDSRFRKESLDPKIAHCLSNFYLSKPPFFPHHPSSFLTLGFGGQITSSSIPASNVLLFFLNQIILDPFSYLTRLGLKCQTPV